MVVFQNVASNSTFCEYSAKGYLAPTSNITSAALSARLRAALMHKECASETTPFP